MRVLVVEDELRLAENIATAFREGPGFAVDVCHDGEDALDLVQAADYDLIVLDLMIPKLPGKEALRKLRIRDGVTPVLILTAVAETRSTIDLLNLGRYEYLRNTVIRGECRRGGGQQTRQYPP